MRKQTRRAVLAMSSGLAALGLSVPSAMATPPSIEQQRDVTPVGATTFNPPELSCSDFGYTWGIQSTVVQVSGVNIVRTTNSGTVEFKNPGVAKVVIEAATGIGQSLGGPQIEVLQSGFAHIEFGTGSTDLTIDFKGRVLLGAALVSGRASVTFDENGFLTAFSVSPHTERLCEALAP